MNNIKTNLETLKKDMQEDQSIELANPRQSSTFDNVDGNDMFIAENALNGDFESYSKTKDESGEYWTAEFADAPKKINKVLVWLAEESHCTHDHMKIFID